jgi:hypothetical protein
MRDDGFRLDKLVLALEDAPPAGDGGRESARADEPPGAGSKVAEGRRAGASPD